MGFKAGDRGSLASLEAQLVNDPGDDAALDRYGQRLRAVGDPRGELIGIDAAWEAASSEAERAERLAERRALFRDCGPTLAPAAIIEMAASASRESPGLEIKLGARSWARWRRGFVRALYLDVADCPGGRLQEVVDELLGHPAAMLLEDLRLAPARLHGVRYPEIVASLARRPPPLRRLEYAARGAPPAVGSFELGDLRRLWPALGRLRELVLAGDAPVLGTVALPQLEALELRGGDIGDPALLDLARSPLPRLERLALDLLPPRRTTALPRFLAAPLIGALRALCLGGELDDADVDALIAHAAALSRLETLDLSGATLPPGAGPTLAARLGALVP